MRGKKRWIVGLAVPIILALTVTAFAAGEALQRAAITGGGGAALSSGDHALRGSLGQPVAGRVGSAGYGLCAGLQCASVEAGEAGGYVYLPLVLSAFGSTPGVIPIEEAPDACPGTAIQVEQQYSEDFDHSNDNDWYEFQAIGGRAYTLRTFDLGSRADTVMYLYGSDCVTLLGENDDVASGDGASQIVWAAPSSGAYHVDVRSYNYTIFGIDTGYKMEIVEGVPGAADPAGAIDKAPPLPTPAPTLGESR